MLALLIALGLWAVEAQAQTPDVCRGGAPAVGEAISCTEAADSTATIDIDATNPAIATTGHDDGIYADHSGMGAIDIDVMGGTITASTTDAESSSNGVHGLHKGDGAISIDVMGGTITMSTTYANSRGNGVHGHHKGNGKVRIDVRNTDIRTGEGQGTGVYGLHEGGLHEGENNVDIDVVGGTITTGDGNSPGVQGHHKGYGNIDVYVENATITTSVSNSQGVYGFHEGAGGDTDIEVIDTDITTAALAATKIATGSAGVIAWHKGDVVGDIAISIRDGSITTWGATDHGVQGTHQGTGDVGITTSGGVAITTESVDIDPTFFDTFSHGVFGYHTGAGSINIDVLQGSSITAKGTISHGVYASHIGTSDIDITLTGATVVTEGPGGHGIYASHQNSSLGSNPVELGGNVDINVQGGSIETLGSYSYGIRGDIEAGNGGGITIVTGGGNTITTTGDNAHGIVAYHFGTMQETSRISIDVGGNVTTTGAGAQGVRVGTLNTDTTDTVPDGTPERVAAIGEDGYRQQTVTVNGAVTSAAEGVFLAGGGRVVIGPKGSIGAESGIAILATGDTPVDGGDPLKPKLRVDMNLGGRRVAQAIGENWIINDGGETTIAVNRVVLHDGAMGVTGRTASNGAWNVRMRAEGVTVTDRTTDPDPANWVVTDPTENVVADRDFSRDDFTERRKPPSPPPPPPPVEPEPEPEPEQPMFHEEYAPRAAIYEALPDFLLRLTGQGPSRTCSSVPDEPVWVRFAGGQGSYEADRSTTGATYNLERFETEGGLSAAFNDTTKGWVSVRHVWGAAGIGSPTGGGQIDVRGLGSSVGGAWQSATGAYAKGCFSYMAYTVDFASNQRGLLKAGTNGRAYTLDVEAGWRFALTEQVQLTPRVWMVGSRVSVDSFTDAVDARVSFAMRTASSAGWGS